jgi:hypothetical protein
MSKTIQPHPKATAIGGFARPRFKDGFKRCGVLWLPPDPLNERPPQLFPVDKFTLEQRKYLLESEELEIREKVSPEDAAADALALAIEQAQQRCEDAAAKLQACELAETQATQNVAIATAELGEAEAALAVLEKRAKRRRPEGLSTSPSVAPEAPAAGKPSPPALEPVPPIEPPPAPVVENAPAPTSSEAPATPPEPAKPAEKTTEPERPGNRRR